MEFEDRRTPQEMAREEIKRQELLEKMQKVNPLPAKHYGIPGWVCPVCGAGLSPGTSRCPCVVQEFKITC